MMDALRSFFGMNASTGKRVVVGKRPDYEAHELEHVRESEANLTALYHLARSYAGTVHEPKIKQVYEKTKEIHHYLVARNRVHELALFHLRNTQHFLNTFRSIIEVHQKPESDIPPQEAYTKARTDHRNESGGNEINKKKPQSAIPEMAELLINLVERKVVEASSRRGWKNGRQSIPVWKARRNPAWESMNGNDSAAGTKYAAPPQAVAAIPEITLNTYEKARYYQKETPEGMEVKEISYISTPIEKEAFLQYVADRLEIRNVSYVGNATFRMPDAQGFIRNEVVPVIHWQGFLYALSLQEYRLFPVKMFRNGL